jgi:hypothetical protein
MIDPGAAQVIVKQLNRWQDLTKLLIMVAAMALSSSAQGQAPLQNRQNSPLAAKSDSTDGTNLVSLAASMLTNRQPVDINQVVPVMELRDVPLASAIDCIATNAGINYLIAPQLEKNKWAGFAQQTVTFRLTNVTAKVVLQQLLALHRLALVEDPVSNIAFIVPADQIANPDFAGLATNASSTHTNRIPVIQFSDVPITTAIDALARQEEINYILDPKLPQSWNGPGSESEREPSVFLHFENVTCWSALNRMLNIRGLVLLEDPLTHVARITSADEPLPIFDASLLEMKTNPSELYSNDIIPLIEFKSVPLDTALEHLLKQSGLNAVLDPQLKDYSDPQNRLPAISLRWTNLTAKQAIVALCENYGFTISKDDSTGVLQIKPEIVKRHHHLQLH